MRWLRLSALGMLCSVALGAPPLDPAWRMVPLKNGLNSVDVNSDGRMDTVVVAHKENFNAHSYEAATIYVWGGIDPKDPPELQVVPLHPSAEEGANRQTSYDLQLKVSGGADALLDDFRLLVDAANHTAYVVRGQRRHGESFVDTQLVDFEFMQLTANDEGSVGLPLLRFRTYARQVSAKAYQDVNDAFLGELKLGPDGRQSSRSQ